MSMTRRHLSTVLKGIALAIAMSGVSAAAIASEPTGYWMVAEGYARIKIGPCGDLYYGVIDWATKPDELDKYNPDPTKRSRVVLGMPILLAMKPSKPNEWTGEVYNTQNGKTYLSKITLLDTNTLRITGCVLGGLFCGGENWKRADEKQMQLTNPPIPGAPANTGQRSGPAPRTPGQALNPRPGQPGARVAADQVCPTN